MNEYDIKTYDNVPSWVKNLKIGEYIMVYFPRKKRIVYSEVLSNVIPQSSDYFAILTIKYKINNLEMLDELLYDNYLGESEADTSWKAYQIM